MHRDGGWNLTSLTRRRALAVAAALAGGSLVSTASAAGRSTSYQALRIGRIVAPQSKRGSVANEAILQGLRVGLSRRGIPADLPAVERYGFSATPVLTAAGSRRGHTVLIGRPDSGAVKTRDLLAIDTGANVPAVNDADPAATLEVWSAAWITGRWAASELGARAVIATSFYDSGYDSLYALHRGYEAGGGEATVYITHRPSGDVDFQALAGLIGDVRPDVVFAAYSGRESDAALRYLASTGVPVVGAPLATDETALDSLGDAALGVLTVLPWAADLPAAREFTATYAAATGGRAGAYAALGDAAAGLLAGEASSTSGFYLRRVVRADGGFVNSALADVSTLAPTTADVREASAGIRSGFITPYALA